VNEQLLPTSKGTFVIADPLPTGHRLLRINAAFRCTSNQLMFGQGFHLVIWSKQRNAAIDPLAEQATNAQTIPCETF
jgi:hypothetical protein